MHKRGIVDVDKGFYHEAKEKGLHSLTYLTDLSQPSDHEIENTYQRCLKKFKQEDDCSPRAEAVWDYAYKCVGLERELAARDIRVKRGGDKVEKFFSSSNDTALFPAFLATQVIAGILESSLVPHLVAAEVPINSHVAEKITMSESEADRQLNFVGEGADIPKTKITTSEGSITLYKYARMLEASYEAIRLQHLDVFSLFLQRMGRQIGIDQSNDLLTTLISGDGNASTAVTDTDAEVSGTLDYDELIRLKLAFPIGYEMLWAVVNDTNLRTILNMAEFKDPLAGFQFQKTGVFAHALGANWLRWTSTNSTAFSTDRILAVDSRVACAMYREGDLLEESDQLIEKQLHQRTMSEWIGFMKLDNNGTQCLDITT